jgi:hypothetical protein
MSGTSPGDGATVIVALLAMRMALTVRLILCAIIAGGCFAKNVRHASAPPGHGSSNIRN